MPKLKYLLICLFSSTCFSQANNNICQQPSFTVQNSQQLKQTLNRVSHCSSKQTISLLPSRYLVSRTMHIKRDNLTLRGNRNAIQSVVISGDKMAKSAQIGSVFKLSGKNITLTGLTIENSGYHLIQIAGEKGAQNPTISHCILRNSYQQLLKVTYGKNLEHRVKNGVIEHCTFEYTAGIGPNWYIGGIDAHGAIGWRIEQNTFKNIASPVKQQAEHAIHFWNKSEHNLVLNNKIINCDRGIGFGLGKKKGNLAGVIKGNVIIHNNNNHPFADVGISLESSPKTEVLNNIIASQHAYPFAIEYRFSTTKDVLIKQNLTNKQIKRRNDSQAVLINNNLLPYNEITSINILNKK